MGGTRMRLRGTNPSSAIVESDGRFVADVVIS